MPKQRNGGARSAARAVAAEEGEHRQRGCAGALVHERPYGAPAVHARTYVLFAKHEVRGRSTERLYGCMRLRSRAVERRRMTSVDGAGARKRSAQGHAVRI